MCPPIPSPHFQSNENHGSSAHNGIMASGLWVGAKIVRGRFELLVEKRVGPHSGPGFHNRSRVFRCRGNPHEWTGLLWRIGAVRSRFRRFRPYRAGNRRVRVWASFDRSLAQNGLRALLLASGTPNGRPFRFLRPISQCLACEPLRRTRCFHSGYIPKISAARSMFLMIGTPKGHRSSQLPHAMQSAPRLPSSR